MQDLREKLRDFYSTRDDDDLDENIIRSGKFNHVRVCKDHLTFDSGRQCHLIHSDELRNAYLRARKHLDYGYEKDFMRGIGPLMARVDHTIRQQKNREDGDNPSVKIPEHILHDPEVEELARRVADAVEASNVAAAEEQFAEVSKLMREAEELDRERQLLMFQKAGLNAEGRSFLPSQFLRVCEVCGALLSDAANDRRLLDHYKGKKHKGLHLVREVRRKVEHWLQHECPSQAAPASQRGVDPVYMNFRRGGNLLRGGRGGGRGRFNDGPRNFGNRDDRFGNDRRDAGPPRDFRDVGRRDADIPRRTDDGLRRIDRRDEPVRRDDRRDDYPRRDDRRDDYRRDEPVRRDDRRDEPVRRDDRRDEPVRRDDRRDDYRREEPRREPRGEYQPREYERRPDARQERDRSPPRAAYVSVYDDL